MALPKHEHTLRTALTDITVTDSSGVASFDSIHESSEVGPGQHGAKVARKVDVIHQASTLSEFHGYHHEVFSATSKVVSSVEIDTNQFEHVHMVDFVHRPEFLANLLPQLVVRHGGQAPLAAEGNSLLLDELERHNASMLDVGGSIHTAEASFSNELFQVVVLDVYGGNLLELLVVHHSFVATILRKVFQSHIKTNQFLHGSFYFRRPRALLEVAALLLSQRVQILTGR